MPAADEGDQFERLLVSLSAQVLGRTSIVDTLRHVAGLARDGIGAADYVAVTTVRDGRPETTVATDPMIDEVDQAQYDADHGPCLDATRTGEAFLIDSTDDDDRWPAFSRAAAGRGIHSTLSLPLVVEGDSIGALNLYSHTRGSFTPEARSLALRFARPAAVLLANAHRFWEARDLADNLQAALDSRAVIDMARGILMNQQGIDADAAFDVLRRASQRENVKLREIARRLVEQAPRRHGPA